MLLSISTSNRSEYPVASQLNRMQRHSDDDEISPSTMPPLQGVAQQYKGTLDSLMTFVHGRVYERDKTYTKGELRARTPKDEIRWMNLRSFGIADPPSDASPTLEQSNLLESW